MMLTIERLQFLCFLSRLKVKQQQEAALLQSLEEILKWSKQLQEVNTENIDETLSPLGMTLEMVEDKATKGLSEGEIFGNAPFCEAGFFVVPKVIE